MAGNRHSELFASPRDLEQKRGVIEERAAFLLKSILVGLKKLSLGRVFRCIHHEPDTPDKSELAT